MAREQQRESGTSTETTSGNGGSETGYTPENRQSRQGNGGSRAMEHTGRRGGALQATRGWPGLLGGGIPSNPWELVRRMSEEMNQLFESLGGTSAAPSGLDRRQTMGTPTLMVPRTEVIQQPDALLVRVEMPGLAADEIDVTVEDGVLTIAGERTQEDRQEGEGFVRSELVYGTFFRSIPLPDGADEDNIVAIVRNGVLEITIPITHHEQGRRVNVQAGEGAEATRGEPGRSGSAEASTGGSSSSGSSTSGSGSGSSTSSRGE